MNMLVLEIEKNITQLWTKINTQIFRGDEVSVKYIMYIWYVQYMPNISTSVYYLSKTNIQSIVQYC